MSDVVRPQLLLQCKLCSHRPPDDSVVEALLLHFQVEHDTSDIVLDLIAVCDCGATMTYRTSHEAHEGIDDLFDCTACGNTGIVHRDA